MSKRSLKISATKTSATKKVAKEVTPTEKPQTIFPRHNVQFNYAGVSSCTTSRKSRTAIDVSGFNTIPDAVLTERDNAFIAGLRSKYKKGEAFVRGDLDAGLLRRAGERGRIEYVEGDLASVHAKFRLTELAFQGSLSLPPRLP